MMGGESCDFPRPPAPPSGSKATRREHEKSMTEGERCDFSRPPAPPSGSIAARRETRGDYDGRQDLAISRDPWHHHPVPKLQEEARQEEIIMETRTCEFPRAPAPPSGSQATRMETRGDYDGRQEEMPISRHHRHHHPAPKLQERKQDQIMMGDKTWQFPGTPGTTIRLPRNTSYKNGGWYEARIYCVYVVMLCSVVLGYVTLCDVM